MQEKQIRVTDLHLFIMKKYRVQHIQDYIAIAFANWIISLLNEGEHRSVLSIWYIIDNHTIWQTNALHHSEGLSVLFQLDIYQTRHADRYVDVVRWIVTVCKNIIIKQDLWKNKLAHINRAASTRPCRPCFIKILAGQIIPLCCHQGLPQSYRNRPDTWSNS